MLHLINIQYNTTFVNTTRLLKNGKNDSAE